MAVQAQPEAPGGRLAALDLAALKLVEAVPVRLLATRAAVRNRLAAVADAQRGACVQPRRPTKEAILSLAKTAGIRRVKFRVPCKLRQMGDIIQRLRAYGRAETILRTKYCVVGYAVQENVAMCSQIYQMH